MAESTVSLDEVIKRLTDTVTQHATTIQQQQQSFDSLQPELDHRIEALKTNTRQGLHAIETNLTTLFASKDRLWTEISNHMRTITFSVLELKNTISNPHLPFSPALNQPPPQTTDTNNTTPLHTTSQLINASSNISYSPQQATTQLLNTIVLPPASSVPAFSGKPTERPQQFLLRVEEYTRTVNN